MVECDLAKVEVAGSNPVSRSKLSWRGTQVVRERSAKPLCDGSIPSRASNPFHTDAMSLWLATVHENH